MKIVTTIIVDSFLSCMTQGYILFVILLLTEVEGIASHITNHSQRKLLHLHSSSPWNKFRKFSVLVTFYTNVTMQIWNIQSINQYKIPSMLVIFTPKTTLFPRLHMLWMVFHSNLHSTWKERMLIISLFMEEAIGIKPQMLRARKKSFHRGFKKSLSNSFLISLRNPQTRSVLLKVLGPTFLLRCNTTRQLKSCFVHSSFLSLQHNTCSVHQNNGLLISTNCFLASGPLFLDKTIGKACTMQNGWNSFWISAHNH